MRLFIAVDLDGAAKAELVAEQKRVAARAKGSAIRWVRAEHLHLTLVFLGEVAEALVPRVIEAIDAGVDHQAFDAVFSGLGVFPERGAPRTLWVGAATGATELRALQHTLAARLAPLGIALDRRPFTPHLTLGRWKESRSADRRRALEATEPPVVARSHVDHATLYHSRLTAEGPTYTELARATLLGGAAAPD